MEVSKFVIIILIDPDVTRSYSTKSITRELEASIILQLSLVDYETQITSVIDLERGDTMAS